MSSASGQELPSQFPPQLELPLSPPPPPPAPLRLQPSALDHAATLALVWWPVGPQSSQPSTIREQGSAPAVERAWSPWPGCPDRRLLLLPCRLAPAIASGSLPGSLFCCPVGRCRGTDSACYPKWLFGGGAGTFNRACQFPKSRARRQNAATASPTSRTTGGSSRLPSRCRGSAIHPSKRIPGWQNSHARTPSWSALRGSASCLMLRPHLLHLHCTSVCGTGFSLDALRLQSLPLSPCALSKIWLVSPIRCSQQSGFINLFRQRPPTASTQLRRCPLCAWPVPWHPWHVCLSWTRDTKHAAIN